MKNIRIAITKAKRRHLTLIEILIVLSILVMLGGLVAFNVRKPLADQNFKNDVQRVIEQIRLTQQLMLIASADIELTFEQGSLFFKSDDKLDSRIDKMIRKEIKLEHIKAVLFDGQPNPKLLFKSRGSIMPSGTLSLKGDNQTKNIVFTGSPTPINSKEKEVLSWDPLIEVTRSEIATPASDAS